jgi:hypothetical protein
MQGISLSHFHVYMYYRYTYNEPGLVHYLHFSFYLSPLVMVISTGLKFYIHSYIGSTTTIFFIHFFSLLREEKIYIIHQIFPMLILLIV